jgi:hypothetical protein
MAALEAAFASWTDPSASLTTRVALLRAGPLAPGKISSNRQHNIPHGGSGPNLFLASSGDTTNKSNRDIVYGL